MVFIFYFVVVLMIVLTCMLASCSCHDGISAYMAGLACLSRRLWLPHGGTYKCVRRDLGTCHLPEESHSPILFMASWQSSRLPKAVNLT